MRIITKKERISLDMHFEDTAAKPHLTAKRWAFFCLFSLLLSLCLLCTGCESAQETVSDTRFMLDTTCTITIYGQQDNTLLDQAFDLIAEYESLLSRTIEGSDVWRINHAQGQPVEVDNRTARLIEKGIYYGDLSHGLFDITIGRLSALWDFGNNSSVPDAEEIQAALDTVDYRKICVEGNTVSLDDAQAMLDLGGIAKGYIADEVASFLLEQEVAAAVINLGGNVVLVGTKPDASAWNIGLEQAFSHHTAIIGVLSFSPPADASTYTSIVTSGIYERNFTVDGQLYHHILDPRSGYPADTDICAVTVVSSSSAEGDALSTICLLLGMEEGTELLASLDSVSGAVWQDSTETIHTSGDLTFTPTE